MDTSFSYRLARKRLLKKIKGKALSDLSKEERERIKREWADCKTLRVEQPRYCRGQGNPRNHDAVFWKG